MEFVYEKFHADNIDLKVAYMCFAFYQGLN